MFKLGVRTYYIRRDKVAVMLYQIRIYVANISQDGQYSPLFSTVFSTNTTRNVTTKTDLRGIDSCTLNSCHFDAIELVIMTKQHQRGVIND